MSTTAAPVRVEEMHAVTRSAPTLGWALRRTLLGIVILVVFIGAAASLLYASIDPEEEALPAATSSTGSIGPALSGHRLPAPKPERRV